MGRSAGRRGQVNRGWGGVAERRRSVLARSDRWLVADWVCIGVALRQEGTSRLGSRGFAAPTAGHACGGPVKALHCGNEPHAAMGREGQERQASALELQGDPVHHVEGFAHTVGQLLATAEGD
jgi:hypothetical protein